MAAVSISKNSQSEWLDNSTPDKNKEYFYALRSVDKAGNASDPIGDTRTTTVKGETLTGPETISGQELIKQKVIPGETKGQILGEKDPEISKEEALGSEQKTEEGPKTAQNQEPPKWLFLIAAGLVIFAYWQLSKKKN